MYTLRAETVADYGAIARLNYDAFMGWHPAHFKAEPLLVDVLRHSALFDPELSLVAELDGKIVGHALFSPFESVVCGSRRKCVVLAPLCVAPAHQRTGIGGLLLTRGHELAKDKGYAFALLCGHPDYYPRFGYRQRMFSLAGVSFVPNMAEASSAEWTERPLLSSDLRWVKELWWEQHGADSLALFPGESIEQWFSHSPRSRSAVISRAQQPVGYVRYVDANPLEIQEFLCAPGLEPGILPWLVAQRQPDGGGVRMALRRATVERLLGDGASDIKDERHTAEAFMIKVLDEDDEALATYCDGVASGQLDAGIISFPAIFAIEA